MDEANNQEHRFTKLHDRYRFHVEGIEFHNCLIAHNAQVQIQNPDEGLYVDLGDTLITHLDTAWTINPEQTSTVAPLFQILGRRIETLDAFDNGTLEIVFEGNWTLRVEPHDQYEGWTLNANGCLFVSTPGGSLTCFTEDFDMPSSD